MSLFQHGIRLRIGRKREKSAWAKKKNIGERRELRGSLWRGNGGAFFPSPDHRLVEKNVREALQGILSQPILSLVVYTLGEKSNFAQELNSAKGLPFSDVKPDTRTLGGGGGGGGNQYYCNV